ncbi:ion channel [Limimaricola litoreus]|uniref:Potassium channel family protein n=1 Tax=Limimaricola litoreus TaxID=2955316 RepID=A0A9X2FQ55_9RHOB|nr:potassium channel family protein [Limimaricola litoreus]
MLIQLGLGYLLIAATALSAALSWWGLELVLNRSHRWVTRPPHGPKLTAILSLAMRWTLLMMSASVWIWAMAFWGLRIFPTVEASVYFALVVFTTLGYGDVLLPVEWCLLGGLAAANGLLIFGLLTEMLVETLRQTRLRQRGRFGQDD